VPALPSDTHVTHSPLRVVTIQTYSRSGGQDALSAAPLVERRRGPTTVRVAGCVASRGRRRRAAATPAESPANEPYDTRPWGESRPLGPQPGSGGGVTREDTATICCEDRSPLVVTRFLARARVGLRPACCEGISVGRRAAWLGSGARNGRPAGSRRGSRVGQVSDR
jgi:hypothetical protein